MFYANEVDYPTRQLYTAQPGYNSNDFDYNRFVGNNAGGNPSFATDYYRDGPAVCFGALKSMLYHNNNYIFGNQVGSTTWAPATIGQYTQRLLLEMIYSPRERKTVDNAGNTIYLPEQAADEALLRQSVLK